MYVCVRRDKKCQKEKKKCQNVNNSASLLSYMDIHFTIAALVVTLKFSKKSWGNTENNKNEI